MSLPTAMALVSSFVSLQDRGAAEPAIERALKRETDEISSAIPHRELAIQWDAVMEIVGHDGGYPLHYSDTVVMSILCRRMSKLAFIFATAIPGTSTSLSRRLCGAVWNSPTESWWAPSAM